ncbi:MAG: hypothetical protein R3F44_05510 [Candidatus Competibacteraceae bacterium]
MGLLEFQLAVAIELDLRAVRQQNRGAAAFAGSQHLAGRQRLPRADGLPASLAQHFGDSHHADDFTHFLG